MESYQHQIDIQAISRRKSITPYFWDNAFSGLGDQDNSTLLISAPTTKGSPVGVDFYEMRRRNVAFETGIYDYDYSPFGVLIPLVEYEGSGFFHCNKPNV